jgi:hypothetical protein
LEESLKTTTLEAVKWIEIQETDWYKKRSKAVRARIDAYPPDRFYQLPDKRIATIHEYLVVNRKCTTCIVKVLKINNPNETRDEARVTVPFDDLLKVREVRNR